MDGISTSAVERRVLFVPPTVRDAELTCALLEKSGIQCTTYRDPAVLCAALATGAGALLLTEDFLLTSAVEPVIAQLAEQPAWSDLPVVVLMHGAARSPIAQGALRSLRNVTLLERPAPVRSVVSAVQAAIRGRERQYLMRDQLQALHDSEAEREQLLESEQAARREAERTSRMKDEFLATLSHELRTPLNAIVGWVELLKRTQNEPETVAEGIEAIDRNVHSQKQLIEDLLDVSRIISGKVRLETQRMDITDAIHGAIESVKPGAEAKGVRIEQRADTQVTLLNGDPARMQQVFWNLLTNAVKFTPKGGTITVVTRTINSHLEISVRDTGQGIAAAFLPRLFERFSQADASTTRRHGGLGLGLSIVKNLVEMHGGTIRAESDGAGRGAAFTITLPVQPMAAQGPSVRAMPQAKARLTERAPLPNLAGLKVLVVDDEPDAREVMRRLLLECAAVPTVAVSAADAQRILTTLEPDIILSDVGMPDRDGYAFMREVRQRGIRTPAVAVTAFARAEDYERSLAAGFQMHLAKPVEPAELLRAITRLTHAHV